MLGVLFLVYGETLFNFAHFTCLTLLPPEEQALTVRPCDTLLLGLYTPALIDFRTEIHLVTLQPAC